MDFLRVVLKENLMVERMVHLILKDFQRECWKVNWRAELMANQIQMDFLMVDLKVGLKAENLVQLIWKDFLRVCLMEMKRAG